MAQCALLGLPPSGRWGSAALAWLAVACVGGGEAGQLVALRAFHWVRVGRSLSPACLPTGRVLIMLIIINDHWRACSRMSRAGHGSPTYYTRESGLTRIREWEHTERA